MEPFLKVLHSETMKNDMEDKLIADNVVSFLSIEIWRVKACSNVKFFRDAKWEEIPTKDPWMKHGWVMVNKCCLCKFREEAANRILIH